MQTSNLLQVNFQRDFLMFGKYEILHIDRLALVQGNMSVLFLVIDHGLLSTNQSQIF